MRWRAGGRRWRGRGQATCAVATTGGMLLSSALGLAGCRARWCGRLLSFLGQPFLSQVVTNGNHESSRVTISRMYKVPCFADSGGKGRKKTGEKKESVHNSPK